MAELVQNSTLVSGLSNGGTVTAGTTITAGMPIFEDVEDGKQYKPSRANALATAKCKGIALNSASDNQPVEYQKVGLISLGCDLIAGEIYCVSADTAGKIFTASDYVGGDFPVVLGIANENNQLKLNISEAGVAYDLGT